MSLIYVYFLNRMPERKRELLRKIERKRQTERDGYNHWEKGEIGKWERRY